MLCEKIIDFKWWKRKFEKSLFIDKYLHMHLLPRCFDSQATSLNRCKKNLVYLNMKTLYSAIYLTTLVSLDYYLSVTSKQRGCHCFLYDFKRSIRGRTCLEHTMTLFIEVNFVGMKLTEDEKKNFNLQTLKSSCPG